MLSFRAGIHIVTKCRLQFLQSYRMAKSKAQRMKEYRQRKKENLGEQWLKIERERVKSYYVPTAQLSEENKEKRRDQNRKNSMVYYSKKKKSASQHEDEPESLETCDDSATDVVSSTTQDEELLTVKMPFHSQIASTSKGKGPKKRQSRALKKSYKRIETLEDQNEILRKKLKTAQKRIERFESAKKKNLTPKSKTDVLLKTSGLNPKDFPDIRKKLLFGECVNEEIRSTVCETPKQKIDIKKVVSGKVMKKYRMRSYVQKMTFLERRKVIKGNVEKKRAQKFKAQQIRNDVQNFLKRDDNSRVLPGKGDSVKVGTEKKQKRVLNDYLHNLHLKFSAEINYRISLASFCKHRPPEITLVNFASRSVCLCSRHQNMSFKLRALKNMNLCSCTSPDTFVDMYRKVPESVDKMLSNIAEKTVKFQQWKRVKLQNGKERMRIIDVEMTKEEFVQIMKKEYMEFVDHVNRVTQQYKSVKVMKEKLPLNHVLIQMDFSENYNCQTVEEIQSAYWNASMVTLHPTIIYFNDENKNLDHKSIVFVSEVLHHNASMVSAIITRVVNTIKSFVKDLKFVHFWTDSPSSQYRNKSIFDLLYNFEKVHGCKATWSYFESGHGKSACDGVGGTAKRNADMAVKQSKAVIQDAHDFFAWASSCQSEIEYQMITPEEYEHCNEHIEARKQDIKTVKGTMSLHAVATDGKGNIMFVRETTCACENCFDENGFNGKSNCKWTKVILKTVDNNSATYTRDSTEPIEKDSQRNVNKVIEATGGEEASVTGSQLKIDVSDFVVAVYDDVCYIGQILEIRAVDSCLLINFMAKSGKVVTRYKWPTPQDREWVERETILKVIDPPQATGKSKRIFAVPDEVIQFMEEYENST